jgi:L-malate glycosyltransferase
MKILFISPRYDGGIGGHVKRVGEKLREYGFEIEFMKAPHLPVKKLKNPSFVMTSTFNAITNRKTYDVVHAFNIPSAFSMKFIKAKKKVISVHGMYSQQIDALHSKTISSKIKDKELDVLKWADKLLTNSKNVKKLYKEKLNLDFDFIYGPIDVEKLKQVKDSPKKRNQVVYIGRNSFEKGIDVLKEAESLIKAKIVYCTDLEWIDAMSILKSSEILIVPSRIDNIPNVIKEALFLKTPIIGTDIEGISEVISNNLNGILVPVEDPQKLANTVNQTLQNSEKIKELTQNGYDFVIKNFSWDTLLPKYVKFYEDLVNE